MFAGSVQTADGEWAQILTQPLVATDQQNNRSLDTTRLCPVASILSLFLAQRALTTSEKHPTKKKSRQQIICSLSIDSTTKSSYIGRYVTRTSCTLPSSSTSNHLDSF